MLHYHISLSYHIATITQDKRFFNQIHYYCMCGVLHNALDYLLPTPIYH